VSKPFCLVDTGFLEAAMNASSLRGQVISNNIANASNPDYEAQTVDFEEDLRQAMAEEEAGDSTARARLKPTVRGTGQKVDVITEMANLAKNQILYNAYANRVSSIYSNMKWIIENSGR
jgi:flagellar basal-body rod protein FlgB